MKKRRSHSNDRRFRLRPRQRYRKPAAAVREVFNFDFAVFNQQNALDQRESQTVALGFVRGIALIEFAEDLRLFLLRIARPAVLDRESDFACIPSQPHSDQPALGTEFDCVAD